MDAARMPGDGSIPRYVHSNRGKDLTECRVVSRGALAATQYIPTTCLSWQITFWLASVVTQSTIALVTCLLYLYIYYPHTALLKSLCKYIDVLKIVFYLKFTLKAPINTRT